MSLLLAMLSMDLEAGPQRRKQPSAAARAEKLTANMEAERKRAAEEAAQEHQKQEAEHKARLETLQREHEEKQRELTAAKNRRTKELLEKEIKELQEKIVETQGHIAANDKKLKVLMPELEKAKATLHTLGG